MLVFWGMRILIFREESRIYWIQWTFFFGGGSRSLFGTTFSQTEKHRQRQQSLEQTSKIIFLLQFLESKTWDCHFSLYTFNTFKCVDAVGFISGCFFFQDRNDRNEKTTEKQKKKKKKSSASVHQGEQWKNLRCLGYVGDYTIRLCRDYSKPL